MLNAIFVALVVLTHLTGQAADTIKVSAGAAPLENIFARIKPKFEAETGIKLELTKATHVTSLEDVANGKADLATVGFAFEDWVKRAEKDGLKASKDSFKHRVIGRDNLIFVTHKSAKASKASNEQLRKIFLGELKEWSEAGGAKEKINPAIAEELPGLVGLVREKILNGFEFGATVTRVKGGLPELKAHVKKTPGAVAFVPMGALDNELAKLETEALGRPVTAVTKGPPSEKLIKLFEFLAKNVADQAK